MFVIITVFLLSYIDVCCSLQNKSSGVECMLKIYENSFEENVVVINSDDFINSLRRFNLSMIIFNFKNRKLYFGEQNFHHYIYLIEVQTVNEIEKIFKTFYGKPFWWSSAKVIINYNGNEDILNIFKSAWYYFVINIVVIYEGMIYTYYPYKDCTKIETYDLVGSCGENTLNYFPNKVPADLNYCEVKLLAYEIPPYVINISERYDARKAGLEVVMIYAVAERMNFDVVHLKEKYLHWGYKYADGSYTLMLKVLMDKRVDVIYGMAVANASMMGEIDSTLYHTSDVTTWFVPVAAPVPHWKHISMIFKFAVWMLILLLFLVNGIIWWIAGKEKENTTYFKGLVGSLLGSWYVLLQGCIKPPKQGVSKMIFVIWTVGSMLIYVALQCQLISILTKPLYEKQISNLEELTQSGLKMGFFLSLADIYKDPSKKVNRIIYNNFISCPLSEQCLNRTAFKRDFAVIKNKKQARYLTTKYYTDSEGKPMVYAFKDVVIPLIPKYNLLKGHPLVERIDHFLLLFQSNGMTSKWDKEITSLVRSAGKSKSGKGQRTNLTLGHLEGAFFLLVLGYLLSLIAFSIELIRYRLEKKSKMKL